MVANEIPVKGIAVYGTAAKTWHEYLVEITRNQNILAGATPEEVDDDVRVTSRVYSLAFHEGMSAEQIKKAHPELTATVDALFPRGMMNDKTLEFWRQLGQQNFARYWAKCNARVLAIHGATDFVSYEADHQLIADVVNRVHPGWGKFASVPDSDHLFHNWKTEKESQSNFGKGKYTPAVADLLIDWMKEVVAQKS
jgi:pimeloyl-ACP methyl ester carboxylesterase